LLLQVGVLHGSPRLSRNVGAPPITPEGRVGPELPLLQNSRIPFQKYGIENAADFRCRN